MSISYLSVCSTWNRNFKKRVGRTVHGPSGSVHTSANLIFHFSNKNGKRKYYLSLSYLHISKYREKKKMVGKFDHFFMFLILKLNSKIQKIPLTAKSDILLFLCS